MVAINFTVFQDKILSGAKRQTIRQKARCKPGDTLHLYTGMRTSSCRLLGTATCTRVEAVHIFGTSERPMIVLDKKRTLRGAPATRFALADGFESVDEFMKFFHQHYGLPFSGYVISWNAFTPVPDVAALSRRAAA